MSNVCKPAENQSLPEDAKQPAAAARQHLSSLLAQGACDMHLHTTHSDGSDTPEALLDRVLKAGLSCFAITDHDHLGGIEPARRRLAKLRQAKPGQPLPQLIAGIELSVDLQGRELHLLAYFPLGGEDKLQPFLTEQLAQRQRRNRQMIRRLRELGYDINEQSFAQMGSGAVGRLQAASLLMQRGYVQSIPQAFSELLAEGKPAYIARPRPDIRQVIDRIHQIGGVAVLAHPALYGWCSGRPVAAKVLLRQLIRLQQAGLDGVEAYHGEASPEQQEEVAAVGKALGLLVTAGSDDHGAHKEKPLLYDQTRFWPKRDEMLVVGALVRQAADMQTSRYLLCRRCAPDKLAGFWELPGGKVEAGETAAAALQRELKEELAVMARIGPPEFVLWHDYPDKRVILAVLQAEVPVDQIILHVHDRCLMVKADEALDLPLLPADVALFEALLQPDPVTGQPG